jgi:2-oxoglutarate ferredoxin oxidoreductase subunit gamma
MKDKTASGSGEGKITRVRFSGFGGQGVVLSGIILGEAAVISGLNAVQTQSYGSESRGGACRSDIIMASEDINELVATSLDILVCMSQPAYERYSGQVLADGTILYDSDLVAMPAAAGTTDARSGREAGASDDSGGEALLAPGGCRCLGIPATRLAKEKLGHRIVANMIVLGHLSTFPGMPSPDAFTESIRRNVPPYSFDLNMKAFHEGRDTLGDEESGQKER